VRAWVRMPFENAVRHVMVIVAATLHLVAVPDFLS
jgi:predicted membrane channel-forming protein YqfA (hemolysin III family)